MFDDDYSGFDEFGMKLGDTERDFLEKAKKLLSATKDPWLTSFTKSLIDQVTRGRTLSEKQLAVFYKNLKNPPKTPDSSAPAPTPTPDKAELLALAQKKLKGLYASEGWNKTFLESIIKQIKSGKALSDKQQSVFEKIPTREPTPSEYVQADPLAPTSPKTQTQLTQSPELRAACIPIFVPSKPITTNGVLVQKEGSCRLCKALKLLHFLEDICQDCDPLPF